MADRQAQGGEVFEIIDHTTATDWERFVANLEEVLTDWRLVDQSKELSSYCELNPGSISSGIWQEKCEELRFGSVKFDIRLQYLSIPQSNSSSQEEPDDIQNAQTCPNGLEEANLETSSLDGNIPKEKEKEHGEHELPEALPECLRDLILHTNDFASRAHCLVRWYNLRKFILLSPKGDTIVSEDRVKLLLSSASIALNNVDCHIPIFVQIHNPKSNFYQGISEHLNIRTNYDMVFYRQKMRKYSYLSDLISLFREKVSCKLDDPLSIIVRLNYRVDSFQFLNSRAKSNQDVAINTNQIRTQGASNLGSRLTRQSLMTSATFEQVIEEIDGLIPHQYPIIRFLYVAAVWPPVSDKGITDSEVHSDLDPAEAPIWIMRCVTHDTGPMKVARATQAIHQLFCHAIDLAYDTMDAVTNLASCDRESLKKSTLRLSYDLATQPEVTISRQPGDNIRKLTALIFHEAVESQKDIDALEQIASNLKKKPSLSEVYRNFNRENRPSVKEFIIRTNISRPFTPISTPALPQQMFATLSDQEFRLCGAFSELTN